MLWFYVFFKSKNCIKGFGEEEEWGEGYENIFY